METWRWVTGPIRYDETCERCCKPLRGDSQIVERYKMRYHIGCFLDYATSQMNATILRNASESG